MEKYNFFGNIKFYYNFIQFNNFRFKIFNIKTLKPLTFNINLSVINLKNFRINYQEKEKINFTITENYGNVSSIKYDLRTYPF